MALERSDKISLGFLGLGALVAIAFGWMTESRAKAEEGEGKKPEPEIKIPKNARLIIVRSPVEGPEGEKTWKEVYQYIEKDRPATPAYIRGLQRKLGLAPSGVADVATTKKLREIYTEYEVLSGPNKGQRVRGPSLYDMIFMVRRPVTQTSVYSGRQYAGLAPRGPARSGKGYAVSAEGAVPSPDKPGVPMELFESKRLERGEGERAAMVMSDKSLETLKELYNLTKQSKTARSVSPFGSAPSVAARSKAIRETTIGLFSGLSPAEQNAYVSAGLVNPSTGELTEKGILEVEEVEEIHPLKSLISSRKQGAVMAMQEAIGVPMTGDLPSGVEVTYRTDDPDLESRRRAVALLRKAKIVPEEKIALIERNIALDTEEAIRAMPKISVQGIDLPSSATVEERKLADAVGKVLAEDANKRALERSERQRLLDEARRLRTAEIISKKPVVR